MSRDAKFSSNEQVPFMEEWKARRERIRLRSSSSNLVVSRSIETNQSHHDGDLPAQPQALHPKQEQSRELGVGHQAETPNKTQPHDDIDNVFHESAISKNKENKEKKGSTQKKHRTQIEKRKLREKRRPTGVVNITPPEDSDENQDQKDIKDGCEAPETDVTNREFLKSQGICKSRTDTCPRSTPQVNNENSQCTKQTRLEELQQEVRGKRQDNHKLSAQLNDREGVLVLLQKERKNLTQRMLRATEENKRLKEENQMLLKMMGQLG